MGGRRKDLNVNKENDLTQFDSLLAFDNGVTGALASCDAVGNIGFHLSKDYIKKEFSYTKVKKQITRIDAVKLRLLVKEAIKDCKNPVAVIERPMVNPTRFISSCSALRALEATLVVLEEFSIPVVYCDSKEWQHKLFGKNVRDTKENSRQLGLELYPQFSKEITRQDADALLILHWYLNKNGRKK